MDTTFTIEGNLEVDDILDHLGLDLDEEGQSLTKVVIIKDSEIRAADIAANRPDQTKKPPVIGVYIDTHHSGANGVLVTEVFGAAQSAGIQEDDLIVAIDGEPTYDIEDIGKSKAGKEVGDLLRVEINREGTRLTIPVTLGESVPKKKEEEVLVAKGKVKQKGFLGVYTEEVDAHIADRLGLDSQLGVYIKQVVPNSGAYQAGLRAGDVMTHIEGKEMDAAWELGEVLSDYEPGDKVLVGYVRNGESAITTVTLTEKIEHKPKPAQWKQIRIEKPYLGVHLESEGPGVRITRLTEGEGAEAAGLQVNDRILEIDQDEVDTFNELAAAIEKRKPGESIRLRISRDGKESKVRATLGSRITHEWITLPPEADMPMEELLKDMDNPEQAMEIQQQYENPSLDMDEFEFFPNPSEGQFRLRFVLPDEGDTDI
ncbi:MAG: PDZ domain-containing protein, partial [Bacteroidota bacterium]